MSSKGFSRLYALLGVLLAVAVLGISLLARDASPRMLSRPTGAARCAEALLSKISSGDYVGASAFLYGTPKLDSGAERSDEISAQIWDAFTSNISYELLGDCYATASGIAQDVRIRSMEIAGVTGSLKQRAQELLEQRVEAAEDMTEVYDENFEYRADFIDQVLRDATQKTLEENSTYADHQVTMNLVYEQGRWWVVPDKALLRAISGEILG